MHANFSIGTLDEEVWKLTEPGTPHPRQRVEAVAKLNAAGVPCGVLIAPILPGLSDRPEQVAAVKAACRKAGATVGPGHEAPPPQGREGTLHGLAGRGPSRSRPRIRAALSRTRLPSEGWRLTHQPQPTSFRLDGRVAIITGASSGIGARAATVLHAAGASVVLAARRTDRIDALADELGDRALAVTVDVADDASVDALVARTLDHFGAIDVVVNNAGFGVPAAAESEAREEFRQTIAVNLVGPFVVTQAAAGHMLERGSGSVVNMASVLGFVGAGRVTSASYCASKGGLINLTRELAAQWARRGVRVNALAPGWFETEMTADFFADEGSQAWIRRNTPMGRGGHETELDGALLFLASDASTS